MSGEAKEHRLIASIDQGTSSSRVMVFSTINGEVVASDQIPVTPSYPASGWIEVDADELYDTTLRCLNSCAEQLIEQGKRVEDVVGLGVTNQRETTVVWNRNTGKPLAPAIVWSDVRTAELVKKFINLTPEKDANAFQKVTGLPIHSYFSALKICWLLENVPAVANAYVDECLLVGTVDSWLIWRLTAGEAHVTDVTNASRTLLFNLHKLNWDANLCNFFGISEQVLPRVVSSSEIVGEIVDPHCKFTRTKICGILGDQQASLVAQTWATSTLDSFGPTVKVTYGTGAFMLWDIGVTPYFSDSGILTTVAFQMGSQKQVHYALEGSISFAGATINWLRQKMHAFFDYEELEQLAKEAYARQKDGLPDPCYLVPAFSGLFCPWWQENARGIVAGLTADVDRADVIYAAIRAAVYQTHDVLNVATFSQGNSSESSTLVRPRELVVDGGMTDNQVLMQSLADILDMIVRKHNHSDRMTALGAAVAAALAVDIDPSGLLSLRLFKQDATESPHTFSSNLTPHTRKVMLTGWHAAIERSLGWIDSSSLAESSDSLINLLYKVKNSTSKSVVRSPVNNLSKTSGTASKNRELALTSWRVTFLMGMSLLLGLCIGTWKRS